MAKDIAGGRATHWQTYGSGLRRAVALHCTLAHSGAWKGVMAHLEEPLTLLALDLPGHGKSADWDGTEDYTRLCARTAAGFIDGPVDLIGHSGGAVAALQFALERPEDVRTLTLIEPVLFAAARGTAEWDQHLAAMAPYKAALDRGERMLAAALFTGIWGTGTPWAGIEARSRQYMADRIHLIEAGMPALAEDNFGILAEGRLEALDLPVMILTGTDCPPVIPTIAEAIAARLPDVGLAEVPGAGHLLPVTHPKQVAGLIDVNLGRD
jgi:pimeloyl-ACP methyl ester carboxylesterase